MKGGGVGVEANHAVFAASIETKASIEAIEGQLAQLQAQNAALSEIDRLQTENKSLEARISARSRGVWSFMHGWGCIPVALIALLLAAILATHITPSAEGEAAMGTGSSAYRTWVAEELATQLQDFHGTDRQCDYRAAPPRDSEEFGEMLRLGMPIVFHNASRAFGDKIWLWREGRYLLEQFGEQRVEASVFDTNRLGERFGRTPEEDEDGWHLRAPFRRPFSLKELLLFNRSDQLAYMEQGDIFSNNERHPPYINEALFAQWSSPRFTQGHHAELVSLWLGRVPPGKIKESATHFDPVDNLFLQLRGRKEFWLFESTSLAALHPMKLRKRYAAHPEGASTLERPGAPEDVQDNFSPVRPQAVHQQIWPRTKFLTKPIKCALHPGDLLLMPAFTWHAVQSFGDDNASLPEPDRFMNIGLSTWFSSDVRYNALFKSVLKVLQH